MATPETCNLGPAHAPKQASVSAFTTLLPDIKRKLITMRRKHTINDDVAINDLSDEDLVSFDASNLEEVRVGKSAYGLHIFGKVHLPKTPDGYIHIRMYAGEGGGERIQKFHSIYFDKDGRVILRKSDELEWFNE